MGARQLMNQSSSYYQRLVDGTDATGFGQAMHRTVKSPTLLFVHLSSFTLNFNKTDL